MFILDIAIVYLICNFLEEILLSLFNLVALCADHRHFFIESLQVGRIDSWDLLHYFDDIWKLRSEAFIDLCAKGNKGTLIGLVLTMQL